MSSFTTRSDDVFLRQGLESNAPDSLVQPMVTVCPQENAGHVEWSMRLIPTNKVSTDNAETMSSMVKLAAEIDFAEQMSGKIAHLSDLAARLRRAWRDPGAGSPASFSGPGCGHASSHQHWAGNWCGVYLRSRCCVVVLLCCCVFVAFTFGSFVIKSL